MWTFYLELMKIGIFEGRVVSVCPDKDRLSQLTGLSFKKEPEYVTNKGCNVVFAIKDVHSDFIGFLTFNLKDRVQYYKSSGKTVYKNRLGWTRAFDGESSIPSNFYMRGDVQICMQGEVELLSLLREVRNPDDEEINYDLTKMFKGDFSSIRFSTKTALFAATVKIDLNGKTINPIYNKAIGNSADFGHFKTVYGDNYIKSLVGKDSLEPYQRFIFNIGNPKFPCPYFYHIGPMKVYIHEENEIRSDRLILKKE